jgi:hypothetical protein
MHNGIRSTAKVGQTTQPNPTCTNTPPRQVPREEAATPRVANPVDMPTSRADATIPHKKSKEMSQERAKMRHLICEATNSRARILQRHQMNLRQSECNKQAQLIHNKETGEFLNYRKLL